METQPTITFIVPVYNEQETLERLVEGIDRAAARWPHEVLLIDDGSTDGSAEALTALHERFPSVGVIRFAANAGKTQALAAGLSHARGEICVTMDADLQDDPAEIPKLLDKLAEGHDLVCGWKADRKDPWHKTLPSKVYNAYIARTFGLRLHDVNTGFKAMKTAVLRKVPLFGDMHRLIPIFAQHAGCRVTEVAVRHHPRRHGASKYGPERFLHGLRDIARARLLTRFEGSIRPYFTRILLWSVLGSSFAISMGGQWAEGIPAPLRFGPALLVAVVCLGVVQHCVHMIRVGPSIVRRAGENKLEAEVAGFDKPRNELRAQEVEKEARAAHQS